MVGNVIGLVIGLILIISVLLPVVVDQVDSQNTTISSNAATILSLLPMFVVLMGLVLVASYLISRGR